MESLNVFLNKLNKINNLVKFRIFKLIILMNSQNFNQVQVFKNFKENQKHKFLKIFRQNNLSKYLNKMINPKFQTIYKQNKIYYL